MLDLNFFVVFHLDKYRVVDNVIGTEYYLSFDFYVLNDEPRAETVLLQVWDDSAWKPVSVNSVVLDVSLTFVFSDSLQAYST